MDIAPPAGTGRSTYDRECFRLSHTAFAILVLATFLAPFAGALDPSLGGALAPETKRYIVGFHEPHGLAVGERYQGEPVVAVDLDLNFAVVETTDPVLLRAKTLTDGNVRYVEYDDPMHGILSFVPNDPKYSDPGHYGSKKIGAEVAWDKTLGSTAVKVAMIDSGIRRTHEDVAGTRLLQGWDFVSGDNDPQDTSGCSYHGTHTTGTAGATIHNGKGIAGMSQHTILPIRAFYVSFIFCTSSVTIEVNSLKYAADQGAHVSSNSWGGGSASTAVNDAIAYAHNKGTIHVAAAGNSGSCTNCVGEPWKSNAARTIIVSASDSNDAFASFSSQGPEVDVAAPGVGILSLDGAGTAAYKKLDGTSMACPHVAGVAALIKALNPGYTFSQVESRITSTAKDLGTAGKDDRFGWGRVQANLAVY